MTPEALEQAAAELAENRLAISKLVELPEEVRPADLDEAYDIQRRQNEILETKGLGRIAGYKIGCTTPVLREYMNIHEPIFGQIFAPTVHSTHADLALSDFVELGIEAEIAARVGTDLPGKDTAYTRDSVAESVEAIMISIELVDARYRNFREVDTPTLAADNFFNGGAILGDPVEDWRGLDLASLEATVTLNDSELGRGPGSLIMDHPLNALAWIANRLCEQNRMLRAGEFVTLGSVVVTHWVKSGDKIRHHIPELGTVSVAVA
ncbi:MAG: sulfate adenylyltransferase [Rhodospirillaceae bacterium]|nr:sulfate adenylyltransferase [Rhodospirillaceae bacterium]|tara:strand:+ start:1432 stop:2226 length:795 start_codon:yes stop_codon:yes gene_type:complete